MENGKIEEIYTKVKQINKTNNAKPNTTPKIQQKYRQIDWNKIWKFYSETKNWPSKYRSIPFSTRKDIYQSSNRTNTKEQ